MFALPASPLLAAPEGAAGSATVESSASGALPVADGLWHDVYHVIAPLDGAPEGEQWWKAFRTDTAVEVVLRVVPGVKGDVHSDAFSRLCAVESAHLQKALEMQFVEGRRIEVWSAPRGEPLDEWRGKRAGVGEPEIEALVREAAEALGALHTSGLAHLGLQPSAIYVHEEKTGLEFTIAGLHTAMRFEGDKLIAAAVNPFYAPPEAATLQLHEAGPGICAWDWWGLGRVVQEMILGHHVYDELPGAEANQPEAMRRTRAEDFLMEIDPQSPRAGAVEVMKADERMTTLLRGLLASSPEGRWGGEFVDRWLQKKSVKENYSDKRILNKFRWNGRLWTVAEAAKELQQADKWAEAAAHVFKSSMAGMLAHYIANTPDQHLVHKQLGELTKFAGGEPLKALPADVTRDLVLMLALLLMGGEGFTWRGRRINGDGLHDLLHEAPGNAERYQFVRVLTHAQITGMVAKYDVTSSRTLAAMAQVAADAEAMIRKQGWLTGKNEKEEEAIFRLAVGPESTLTEAYGRLKKDYASANDALMKAILKKEKPSRTELVVAAWVEPKASTLGMVTHQEMKARRLQELGEKCQQVGALLFWQKLVRPLRAGPLAFGSRWLLLGMWLGIGPLLAVHVPGLLGIFFALLPFALVAGLRFGLHTVLAKPIKRMNPDAKLWAWWREPQPQVQTASAALATKLNLPDTLADSLALLAKLTSERTELAKPGAAEALPRPPRHLEVWMVAVASWVLLVAVVGGSVGWSFYRPPALKEHRKYWSELFRSNEEDKPKVIKPEDQLITWPYKAPMDTPFEIITLGQFTPTAAQTRISMDRARTQCKGYKPESIHSLIAIYTPLEGNKGGLLLYDGQKGAFLGQNGVLINFVPVPKMWMQIGDKRALFIEK